MLLVTSNRYRDIKAYKRVNKQLRNKSLKTLTTQFCNGVALQHYIKILLEKWLKQEENTNIRRARNES